MVALSRKFEELKHWNSYFVELRQTRASNSKPRYTSA
jgi:hypothetical protein